MKKFTTATTDIKKRRILRVVPVLAAAGILSVVLTGCGSSDEEVQRYSWPLATASPEVRSHRFLQKNSLRKFPT